MEGHKDYLFSGLQSLRSSLIHNDLPNSWSWSKEIPTRNVAVGSVWNTADTNSLEVQCLLKHLNPDDPILVGHARSCELFEAFRTLSGDLYEELINAGRALGDELGIPLQSGSAIPILSITPGLVDFLYEDAKFFIFSGESRHSENQYRVESEPYPEARELAKL